MTKKDDTAGVYKLHTTPSSSVSRSRVLEVKTSTSESSKPSEKRPALSYLRRVSLYVVFHIFNSIFGVAAFGIVIAGSSIGVALLPVCGFGVVVFQALGVITEKLAILDVAIANLLTEEHTSEKRLRVHSGIKVSDFAVPRGDTSSIEETCILSSSNKAILKVTIYFATIKFAASALSCCAVAFVVSFPIAALSSSDAPDLPSCGHECADKPVVFLLVTLGVFVLSNVLFVLIAMISRELTELACADRRSAKLGNEVVQADALSRGCVEALAAHV